MPKTARPDGSSKLSPLNMRTTLDTRAKLEAAAARSGRSLVREVEVRLERSLADEHELISLWGQDVFSIAESMAKSLWHIEQENRSRWIDDERSFEDFKATTVALVEAYRALVLRQRASPPKGRPAELSTEERARYFAALGGIAPPRPLDPATPERDAAEGAAEAAAWNSRMTAAGSRPLPKAMEIYEKRKSEAVGASKPTKGKRS